MDINLIRADSGKVVKESQLKRFASVAVVDEILETDEKWKKIAFESNQANRRANDVVKEISKLKEENKSADISELRKESLSIKTIAIELESQQRELLLERDKLLNTIGNLVHESVPVSDSESGYVVVKTIYIDTFNEIGRKRKHHELLYMIGGYNPEMGTKVAGHRGYYLTGFGCLLNQALIQYSLEFLWRKGYQHVQTPFFMKQSIMDKVASLAEFDEGLYKISGTEEPNYLIATSEQPLCAMNMNKSFSNKDLPIKYAGVSTCFRKEAGSHGKDIRGIFRVHQFEKIEQFVICPPSESWKMHEEMLAISEEFYASLGISYRVINIPSCDLNNAASKKYDLEGWFPGQDAYRELVSCSNCTDYQARKMNIRYNSKEKQEYVHMLNSTLCATGRTLCCLLETYQTETGILIPKVLNRYLKPYLNKPSNMDKVSSKDTTYTIPFIQTYDLSE
jgi:seryl-tRNA synthetase